MSEKAVRGIERLQQKLDAAMKSESYYEAHQLYRTLYFRYSAKQNYSELQNILYNGSSELLKKHQQQSGCDLASLLVDVLVKSSEPVAEPWILKLISLFQLMDNIPEKDAFLVSATTWSMGTGKRGHPMWHRLIAEIYWKEKRTALAHQHFILSDDGTSYAKMLLELESDNETKSDSANLIALAVLRFLCLGKLSEATEAFSYYMEHHPEIKNNKGPPYSVRTLNFIWCLLRALEMKDKGLKTFQTLKQRYADMLTPEHAYSGYMDKIGYVFFKIKIPPKSGSKSGLAGLFKSMLADAELSGDEAQEPSSSTNTVPDLD